MSTEGPEHIPAPAGPRRIRALSSLVASQIAAGEVVERPSSVVKELVENAIDAGSARITLELEQGGIELVRVTDDGGGIDPADLPMAIAPHATSKITSADDLNQIATLGFRGEALASISSVSRLSIRSRTSREPAASLLECEADVAQPVRPAAGPRGTCVSVKNLFFNTPARRKFLKTVPTEQERCTEVMRAVALAHPAVGFKVVCDGRTSLDVPPEQSPRERVLGILGTELASQLLEIHADEYDDTRGVTLWGLAGLPAIARGTNKSQFIFINGRPVRDRTIQHAIAEAYRGLIEPGRFPTIVLMIEMSPAGVDVNVHPAKAEVRFRDSGLVHSVVYHAVKRALQRADLTPTLSVARPSSMSPHMAALPGSGLAQYAKPDDRSISTFVEHFTAQAPAHAGPKFDFGAVQQAIESAPDAPTPVAAPEPVIPLPSPATRILQVHKSYLVTQDEQGVVIIDQHALHERVMFEYLLERVTRGQLESQRLLAPVVVPASSRQIERLPELAGLLERIGVDAAPLGPHSLGVSAFPSFLFERGVDPVDFMTGLLERAESEAFIGELKQGGEAAMRDVLDMMSCKAAVKAGDRLTDLELGELVALREQVERSSNCPHGRPTSVRLTIRELEKLFQR
ncbi:MAG: DNA mismatch repair endonuclease MutL [Phycisphaerales bacterium]